ncbi:tail fiber protein [Aggregatibacter sp. 2125159857]|uniref:tail fiber protein n=1 Tax=Aggregatibacter sp. 2125159857 TaxID=2820817 RepID=UPI001FD849D1|nr:tail fiber protein [Aggregatibacter sp. 2125159857]
MGKITEQQQWEEDIYLIEKQDKVLGGELGVINVQAKQLANRTKYLKGQVDTINLDRTGYAPKASPAFTGVPTAPTAVLGTNNTQIATTAFVKTAIAALVGSAPAALDTLEELARALAGDANLKATLLEEIGKKANASHTHTMAQITDFATNQLNTEDLDTVVKTGIYGQGANRNATLARHYPEEGKSGMLITHKESGNSTHQIFTVFDTGHQYSRGKNAQQQWLPWVRIDGIDKANAIDFNALHDLFIGIPIPYPLSSVPTGCLAMNGQRFDTRRYPKLAQKYPSGQLPDLRGEFIRGWDNGRGVDVGRALLSAQGDAIRNITGEVNTDNGWFFNTLVGAFYDSKEAYTNQQKQRTRAQVIPANDTPDLKKGYFGFNASRVVPTANENRPRNIAFHYICLAA